ncbi:MAG: carboxypeptidase-like regulatory domain-containing protein, partial [Flavobacteriales bacterium]
MIKYFVLTILSAITLVSISAHTTLSGRVRNAVTGEYILGAYVIIENNTSGVSTNLYGFYSLSLPEGEHSIKYSFIGFESLTVNVNMTESRVKDVDLVPQTVEIKGAYIIGDKGENTNSTELGSTVVSIE